MQASGCVAFQDLFKCCADNSLFSVQQIRSRTDIIHSYYLNCVYGHSAEFD